MSERKPLLLGGFTHAPDGSGVAAFDAAALVREAGAVRTLIEWARGQALPLHVREAVDRVARAIGVRDG